MSGINQGMRRQKRDLFIDANDPTKGRICFSIEREKATAEHHAFIESIHEQIVAFIGRDPLSPSPPDSPGDRPGGGGVGENDNNEPRT